jgi:hypothetical protein
MSINAAALRNILAVMRNIDRDELPAMTDRTWEKFRDDPYRGFLRLADADQAHVASVVSGRLPSVERRSPCKSA